MPKHDMSFLPADYIARRIEQRTNLICLTLFVVVLCGVIGAYLVTSRHRGEVRAQREQVNAAYTEAARRIEQLETLQQQKEQMLRKAQLTAMLIEPVPRSFLLADLINRMPETLSLLEVQLHTKQEQVRRATPTKSELANKSKAAKTAANDPPPMPKQIVTLVLMGVAPTDVQVAQYLSDLSRSALLSEVSLVYSEETRLQEAMMRKFRVEMTLNDSADVRRMQPNDVPRLPRDPLNNSKSPAQLTAVPITPPSDVRAHKPGAED